MTQGEKEYVDHETVKSLRAVSQELPGILDAVTEKLPALIRSLIEAAYSEATGRNLGKSVAAFYATLKEQGLPEGTIERMMEEFVRAQASILTNATKDLGR